MTSPLLFFSSVENTGREIGTFGADLCLSTRYQTCAVFLPLRPRVQPLRFGLAPSSITCFSVCLNFIACSLERPCTELIVQVRDHGIVVAGLMRQFFVRSHVGSVNDMNSEALLHEFCKEIAPRSTRLTEKAIGLGGDIGLCIRHTSLVLECVNWDPHAGDSAWRLIRPVCHRSTLRRTDNAEL